ncbi:MAG TPA: hypothetical protein VHX86_14560 [Tepidisphaeraceae bacterium]|jgi:hypothetical protein|nr:hypothetical protein [Tepidisphaeraceae bacterium]
MNASQKQNEIDRVLARGMTVAQLIETLQDMPQEAVVVFGSDYGDICHTEQALIVREVVEVDPTTERLETSAYSHSGIAIESLDADEDEGDEEKCPAADETSRIVILRS